MENEPNEPAAAQADPLDKHKHRWHNFVLWYGSHKKWSIPGTILIILVILAAVPWTRFKVAGLFLKKNFTVQVTDATAHIPVSGATVSVGSIKATTNGSGKAILRGVKVGGRSFTVAKKYYQNKAVNAVVPILNQKSDPDVLLVATGRQAKIHVTNLINGKVLPDVDIKLAGAAAKTDSQGNALVVLPANGGAQKAALSLDGYNDSSQTVQISNSSVKENDFKLTPAGKVYFVSNRSGKIDVLKANLDGSDVQTAVAGTGNEVQYQTQIKESADGKFVALVAHRSASDPTPQLYVLATADDKLLEADSGNANFQLVDWVGDTLVYTVARLDLPVTQQGLNKLKAYNAQTGDITPLDQAQGATAGTNGNEYYAFVMATPDGVVYGKTLKGGGSWTNMNESLQMIKVDGSGHQTLATYPHEDEAYFVQNGPETVGIWAQNTLTHQDAFTQFTVGGAIKPLDTDSDHFYDNSNTYYFSASGKQTLWSEPRDNKNTIMVGQADGSSPATIASASDYQPFGWFTDQYVLLSKDSTLYVMSAKGGTPVRISDYLPVGSYGY